MYLSSMINFDDPALAMQSADTPGEEVSPTSHPSHAVFLSQAKFSTWFQQSSISQRDQVTTLKLYLTDFDIAPLITQNRLRHPSSTPTLWSLCGDELRRLQHGLQGLRSLTFLYIIAPEHAQPAFWQAVYGPLLVTLRTNCPRLVHLEVHDSPGLQDMIPLLEQAFRVTVTKEGIVPRPNGDNQGIRPGQIPAVLDLRTALRIVHGDSETGLMPASSFTSLHNPLEGEGRDRTASSSGR